MKDKLNYRTLSVRVNDNGIPASLDPETRSVEIVAATENPAQVYDYERWEVVTEILLMSGAEIPPSRQVPLLDSHQRYDTASVIGSVRDIKVSGSQVIGRSYFSSVPEAESPYTKVREGHLTDFSVGYKVDQAEWIPEGETAKINGKTYQGPLKVATKWMLKEVSAVPIGADQDAKSRAMPNQGGKRIMKIDEKLRAILVARGLPETATDEEAWAFMERLTLPDQPKPKEGKESAPDEARTDEDRIREAIATERGRVKEIKAMCQRFQCNLADDLIAKGTSLEEARKAVMDHVARTMETAGGAGYRPPAEMLKDERDKFRSAAIDAVMLRGGAIMETPAPGARELRGYTLREMAREALRIAGLSTGGDPREMIGRALTASDFPYILADSARKSLFAGYDVAQETWRDWCGTGSVSDFKAHTMVRAGEFDDLEEVPEHAEYRYGKRSEARETYQIITYGKLFAITRQTIINDDLNALIDVPRGHGEAAARKVGDLPYAVLTANAAMGDEVVLFHATHANLGTGGVPSETTLAEAIKLMKLQKDIGGKRRLNIRPVFFLAPVALEGSGEIFFKSNLLGTQAKPQQINPYSGDYFIRVYEPRLDDDSATAWYLAGPKGKTVTVYFLNGVQEPYLETKQGWSVDGVEYKVRIDAGAKAVDWRALTKNAGA